MKSFYCYDLNTSTNLDLRYHLFDENVFVGVAVFMLGTLKSSRRI